MGVITIDLSFARSPLFVRQTLASAFGIPLGQEFTWNSLTTLVCETTRMSVPDRLSVVGISQLGVALPDEEKSLRELLRALQAQLPDLRILITLHD
ncbi:hypothetical protein [Acidovorax cavernicola]|uniref:Uncharacterized protein n=1 Tax=Acidovorax cavernicola TaxID=1675792 RepID=A0A9X8GX67_9BURK|nr:hypothetical protein [Acidovorax cavernicola]RIX84038.1 hypothetical protein D3H34_04775 [Acidovorax cavernicola]